MSGLGSSTVWCDYGIGLHEIRAKLRGSEKNTSGSPTTRYSHLSPTAIQFHPRWEEPIYTGPGQLGRRDIDPSTVLTVNPRKEGWRETYRQCWWAPMEFDNWQLDAPIGQWVANDDDLPNLERGLVCQRPVKPGRLVDQSLLLPRAAPATLAGCPGRTTVNGGRYGIGLWLSWSQGDPLTNSPSGSCPASIGKGTVKWASAILTTPKTYFSASMAGARGFQRMTDGPAPRHNAVVFSNRFRSSLRAPSRRLLFDDCQWLRLLDR